MFNRVFLVVISAISVIWIAYVGYDLLDQSDKITPQHIFGTRDGEILIINRTDEVDLAQLSFEVNPEIQPLLDKMLAVPYHNERFYISKKQAVILVELPYLWNRSIVDKFFTSKSMQVSGTEIFALENGFKARFQRNFLLIFKTEPEPADEDLQWPIWDKKATASIIQLNQPLRSTDVYFKPDGTISYQTKYSKDINSTKVDDQDLFAEVLPNKLKNYHFYERKFAVTTDVLDESSPLYQWTEAGFVLFNYNGKPCIIADYASGQDPFVVISEKLSNTDTTSQSEGQRIRNIQLTKKFPADVSKGFFMMKIADKVVIAENKETCEQIVADYKIGKTLALTETVKNGIYMKLPRKVSERYVAGNMAYSRSAYKNILIRTQVANLVSSELPEEAPKAEEDLNWTQVVDGEVIHLLGRGNQQFIWTNTGKVISVSSKKRRWQLTIDGKLINEPEFIDLQENGKTQILFNTASTIYLVDMNGKNLDGFPVKLNNEATNSVTYYRWKNTGNFLVVDDKNQLIQFDQKGRQTDVLKLNVGNCKNAVDVFNQKGNLIAVASGSERTQTVNLVKFRIVKTHESAIAQERVAVKGGEGPSYYSFEKGGLQRQDYTGAEITLANYPAPEQFKLIEGKNYKYIAFSSYNKIHVLNERGVKLFQFEIPFRELASFDVITLQNGKTYIAMIDGIENNLYVYDNSGRCYTEKPLEGKGSVLLSEKGSNNLVITTSGDGFVVQYFDVLKNAPKQQSHPDDE